MGNKGLGTFWMLFAAAWLSLSWLIPNHSPPWLGFHSDALAATTLLLVSAFVLWRANPPIEWHWPSILTAALCIIPFAQYSAGMISFFGEAWVQALYLLGFLLSLQVGAKWEKESAGQCADFLFFAIGLAALISTAIQFHQWLGLEAIGPWTLRVQEGRYFANMAQPNQLASLLLLGTLSTAWGYERKKIGALSAVCLTIFLLFGTALTQSRTAWLNIALIICGAIIYRKQLPSKNYLWVILGITLFFIASVLALPFLNTILDAGNLPIEHRTLQDSARLTAWKMLWQAASERPFWGFGWGQLAQANFLVADDFPPMGGFFLQSHNLFLDLILWNGFPIGISIAIVIAIWGWLVIKHQSTFNQLILIAFVMILATHAMLEYPLQYAYFLLPFGMVIGVLNSSAGLRPAISARKKYDIALILIAGGALSITVHDYLHVETSFYGFRFEQRKIKTSIPPTPPDVFVLTQWREHLRFARQEPKTGLSPTELKGMLDVVNTIPSAFLMHKYAANLAMNNQPEEASGWLRKLCKTTPESNCLAMKTQWEEQAKSNSFIAAVPWPTLQKSER